MRIILLCWLATLVTVLAASPASAGSFSVTPVRVDLDPGGRAQTVELRNDGAAAVMIQVEAFDWTDRAEAVEELAPTGDVLAAPPVFEFGPGESQIIRLALRRPLAGAEERAYRLVISEVPNELQAGNGVAVALRLNLPVFVTPPGAAPEPVWTAHRLPDGGGELRLSNPGTAHVQLRRIRLAAEEGRGRPLLDTEEADRVLAGRERVWRFDAGTLPPSARLRVNAVTNAGELDAVVPLQSG